MNTYVNDWTSLGEESPFELSRLKGELPDWLPPEYYSFVENNKEGEGSLPNQPWYFCVYSIAELRDFANWPIQQELMALGHFAIGSNGASEVLAIEIARGIPFMRMIR